MPSHLCRSRQPLTTASQCTPGNALDFDTLGTWSGIKLLRSFLLRSSKTIKKCGNLNPDHGPKVFKCCVLSTVLWLMAVFIHLSTNTCMRVPKVTSGNVSIHPNCVSNVTSLLCVHVLHVHTCVHSYTCTCMHSVVVNQIVYTVYIYVCSYVHNKFNALFMHGHQ